MNKPGFPSASNFIRQIIESEPNNDTNHAQRVELPASIHGVIREAAESDFFRLNARKDQRLIFDVYAFRAGSPLDSSLALLDAAGKELVRSEDVNGLDSLVDFTVPDSAVENAREAVSAGVHVVIGTTGFDAALLEDLRGGRANVFVAPNFAIGAVLMMRFAVNRSRIRPQFAIHYLQTPAIKMQIQRRAKDAVNQSSINQQDVRAGSFLVSGHHSSRTREQRDHESQGGEAA